MRTFLKKIDERVETGVRWASVVLGVVLATVIWSFLGIGALFIKALPLAVAVVMAVLALSWLGVL